ncbi:SPFH domain-containing protein [Streptacidiphilus jiangxiensis]|uniref:Regulator of protease activity HflC, stomatin/prohibitin superfamily n=1 Tax=Streptacidiphilus jiangxiensis TaxID=235985 RepID=A0A1H7QGR3_STRJI|nr:SPFH domain-containing protein [Streptacidiphilus jiangxiensis]SEL46938.1 Regulator of protease activity HflC, stomatin/prohibitin superfamily [Streptacidiphilus jiangxiensis]
MDGAGAISERVARSVTGAVMLPVGLAVAGVGVALLSTSRPAGGVLVFVGVLVLAGLVAVAPGQARVVSLFGRYDGTVRTTGLRWVNPLTRRQRVSTRIRNHETATLKVNDADGNPIEMAAVVVWQVADTAKSVYDVENIVSFVATQAETAVRHVAGAYPYDARGEERLSLRENAEEITSRMSAEIADRVALGGVAVVESRITRLSYAPEIAQAMLRRQQAEAVVDARRRVVEGAVGMVRMALDQLAEEDLVDLDEERKAAMVSNLLVVLCSETATQPVVNTGTLYQ